MTKTRAGVTVSLGLILAVLLPVGNAQDLPCADAQSRRAEAEADSLRTWVALHASYKLYQRCDDGAVGEGYSESVARILVDHWSTLPQLARLAKQDPGFRAFVMGHVDATLDMDDVRRIRHNAETRCPAGLKATCDDLAERAISAMKEGASTH
jgi:hypothetical protein